MAVLTLQARAMAVGQVLVGFFDIPRSIEQPLQLVINPEARTGCVPLLPCMSQMWFALLQRAHNMQGCVLEGQLQVGKHPLKFVVSAVVPELN